MDKFWRAIAWKLPRRLVYWAAIRVMSEASTGKYSATLVGDLPAMDAIRAWEQS